MSELLFPLAITNAILAFIAIQCYFIREELKKK